jgi:hypothetical protein
MTSGPPRGGGQPSFSPADNIDRDVAVPGQPFTQLLAAAGTNASGAFT